MSEQSKILCELQNVCLSGSTRPGPARENVAGEDLLHDISLTLRENDFVAVLGPPGCGKSVLLRILCGLVPPSSGQVFVRGKPLAGINPLVSMVFQSFALLPWLTVRENVMLGLINSPLPRGEIARRFESVISMIGLSGYEEVLPRELSGGMKQRVGLARALILRPQILCLDEPFGDLDVLTAETLRNETSRIIADPASGINALLVATHNVEEAVLLARKIVVLAAHPGRIQAVMHNDLPYPRKTGTRRFEEFATEIHKALTSSMLTGKKSVAAAGTAIPDSQAPESKIEPLPQVNLAEISGLLESINTQTHDLPELAAEIGREFSLILPVVRGAEMLDMAHVQGQSIALTEEGLRFINASNIERRRILNSQMSRIPLIQMILEMIQNSPGQLITENELGDRLKSLFPNQPLASLLQTVILWGRYAELIEADRQAKTIGPFEKKYFGKPSAERLLEAG
ncbi:MAG: nitrate/sulfonate/bicarbonate ABC transporter ATP-binding protein, partial [Verrucomicrobiae bacterium]|nr:nitrate/sulfonate/bicarbonate ABC transporter ATP-binding protein [Verrucomicrobiae bacterium]